MKLSIVMTTRNDMYDGDQLYRNQICIETLLELADIYQLDAELIIVEWNPLDDKPRLEDAIQWPDVCSIPVRIIEVPPHIHKRIEGESGVPFFQMWAKNVGIRRARGEFVLCTNADLVFSRELVSFLANSPLDPECYYRTGRHDLSKRRVLGKTLDKKLRYCAENVGHVCLGSVDANGEERPYSNACGDFTLMHRDKWFELKGYLELPLWSIFIDGILIHTAYALGIKQVCLGYPIYHIYHDKAWSVTDEMGSHYPSYPPEKYSCISARILAERRVIEENPDDSWGLVYYTLPETGRSYISSPVVQQKPTVTIFTTTKQFYGKADTAQRNAINSWGNMVPSPEIIIVGNEVLPVAHELGVKVVTEVLRDRDVEAPLVSSVFRQGTRWAGGDIQVYVNADVILLDGFMETLLRVADEYLQFLMVGQRHDVELNEPLDFSNLRWRAKIRSLVKERGTLHPPCGIDYFAFRRGLYDGGIPDFVIGYTTWDNWLVLDAKERGIPIVDATACVTAVCQVYSGDRQHVEQSATCKRNRELGGRAARSYDGCIDRASTVKLKSKHR